MSRHWREENSQLLDVDEGSDRIDVEDTSTGEPELGTHFRNGECAEVPAYLQTIDFRTGSIKVAAPKAPDGGRHFRASDASDTIPFYKRVVYAVDWTQLLSDTDVIDLRDGVIPHVESAAFAEVEVELEEFVDEESAPAAIHSADGRKDSASTPEVSYVSAASTGLPSVETLLAELEALITAQSPSAVPVVADEASLLALELPKEKLPDRKVETWNLSALDDVETNTLGFDYEPADERPWIRGRRILRFEAALVASVVGVTLWFASGTPGMSNENSTTVAAARTDSAVASRGVGREIEGLAVLTTGGIPVVTVPPAPTTSLPPTTTTTTTPVKPKAAPVTKEAFAPSSATASGDVWARLAKCESGMRNDGGAPYYGYFQFSAATWKSIGGTGLPNDHTYDEQKALAIKLQARSGWGQWPVCSKVALGG